MIEFHILSSFKRLMDSTYQFHRVLRCIDKQSRSSEQNNRIQSRESCCRWECTSHCANTVATCKACFRTEYRCTLPGTHSGNQPVHSRICHRVDTWRFCSGRCGFHIAVLKVSKIRAGNVFLSHLTAPYMQRQYHSVLSPPCQITTLCAFTTLYFVLRSPPTLISYDTIAHTIPYFPYHTIPYPYHTAP
jgi:hypothetical protein